MSYRNREETNELNDFCTQEFATNNDVVVTLNVMRFNVLSFVTDSVVFGIHINGSVLMSTDGFMHWRTTPIDPKYVIFIFR